MLRAIAEVNACNKQFAAEWDPLHFSDPILRCSARWRGVRECGTLCTKL